MKKMKIFNIFFVLSLLFIFSACSDDEDSTELKNDCIKRTIGPNVVGLEINYAYGMAIPPEFGKLVSAQVEASIAGASETWMEHNSYHTSGSGIDVPVLVGNPSVTSGTKTEVTFVVDTCAATLRYYYKIPEEARGKEVSFTFSATASNGETVTYKMGPEIIARMDMKKNISVSNADKCYISIADMEAYDATEAASKTGSIDLIYLYRKIAGITFEHAYVSPVADANYLQGAVVPAGASNSTLIRKVYGLRDRHLANLQYGVYVDDIDLQTLDFTGMPNYAINVKNEGGMWVKTQDGKYHAYIYVNSVNSNGSAVISMKRYTMQ